MRFKTFAFIFIMFLVVGTVSHFALPDRDIEDSVDRQGGKISVTDEPGQDSFLGIVQRIRIKD